MRLLSVKIRNYRIHREQTITFDSARTLIGGPNETGKSTIVEAVHRALFLKAKGNTAVHRAMIPVSGGHPEVELVFETKGQTATLKKRFGGTGTTALSLEGKETIAGEQAETELAQLLDVPAGLAGNALLAQWGHLWVWQGKACEDPSAHATAMKEDLLQRLQAMGAAAVLRSELDSRVAARFSEAYGEMFTNQGRPRATSELDMAHTAAAHARAEWDTAQARVAKEQAAAEALERSEASLPEVEKQLVALEKEQGKIEARADQLAKLQAQRQEAGFACKMDEERHTALKTANARISTLETMVEKREAALAPVQADLARALQATTAAREAATAAERAHDAAAEAARVARLRRDLAQARRRLGGLRKEHRSLSERQERVKALRACLAKLEQQRGQLPNLTEARVRKLQRLEGECDKARHAVQTVAAGIEVLATDAEIVVEGQPLAPGQRRILTAEAEVRIGEGIRLRIFPGGGTTLAEARQAVTLAEKTLRAALDELALESVAKAAELLAQREYLNGEIKAAGAQLEAMDAGEVDAQLSRAAEEVGSVEATVQRLCGIIQGGDEPEEEDALIANARTAEDAVRLAEDAERTTKELRDRAVNTVQEIAEAHARQQEAFERDHRAIEEQRAELRVLIQAHGEARARTEALLQMEAALKTARMRLETLDAKIAELQPDLLPADRLRLQRSLGGARERRAELHRERAVAEASLRSDGREDPRAAVAMAEAKHRAAAERLGRAQRQARAIELLHAAFQEEQRALAEQFTRPLAEKISGYLQCLFGPSARAYVELNEDGFTGLKIAKGGPNATTHVFEALSGGTREQTAAAARLAMAEVLAANYDGTLPVVFDDAFVYSDPERVQKLQRMLDLAASRGLQVIVLTCNPGDYAALGAHQITLSPPRDGVQGEGAPPVEIANAVTSRMEGEWSDHSLAAEAEAPYEPAVTAERREQFIQCLKELGGSAANGSLRESLGLDEPTYERVKRELSEGGRITMGRGRGGRVLLIGS